MKQKTSSSKGFSALEAISTAIEQVYEWHKSPKAVCSSKEWCARGFVYITCVGNDWYVLVNHLDLNIAAAQAVFEGENDLMDYLYFTPLSRDESVAKRAATGEYKCVYKVE